MPVKLHSTILLFTCGRPLRLFASPPSIGSATTSNQVLVVGTFAHINSVLSERNVVHA